MAKKKSVVHHKKAHNPLESPIIQIGIVFIILCAFYFMFVAGQITSASSAGMPGY